jgi:hypothetical protein
MFLEVTRRRRDDLLHRFQAPPIKADARSMARALHTIKKPTKGRQKTRKRRVPRKINSLTKSWAELARRAEEAERNRDGRRAGKPCPIVAPDVSPGFARLAITPRMGGGIFLT